MPGDILALFFLHSDLNPLYDSSLAFCGDLLRALERDER